MRDRIKSLSYKSVNIHGSSHSINTLLKSALIVNSLIVLIGNNIANFVAYIYHLVMGRILGPIAYGDLAAFISVITLIGTAFSFFSLVIVRYSATYTKHENAIFFQWMRKIAVVVSIVACVTLLIFSNQISNYTHINIYVTYTTGPIIAVLILIMVYKGFLQGLVRFKEIVISSNLEMILRLFLSLAFVYLGMEVLGAVLGYLTASVIGLLLASYYLKDLRSTKTVERFKQRREVFKYTIPVFVSYVATNSFFASDVILAKHYLDPLEAGLYAALSNFGKILFFATAPIAVVMFPLVAKRYKEGGNYKSILYLSIVMSLAIIALVLGIYYFFPELMINILFGAKYLAASTYLFRFGLFMSIFVIATLIINYFLSINKAKVVYIALIGCIVQIFGIYKYHDNIVQIINVSIFASFILLFGSVCYLLFDNNNETKK